MKKWIKEIIIFIWLVAAVLYVHLDDYEQIHRSEVENDRPKSSPP